jgi:hypothetical protein
MGARDARGVCGVGRRDAYVRANGDALLQSFCFPDVKVSTFQIAMLRLGTNLFLFW